MNRSAFRGRRTLQGDTTANYPTTFGLSNFSTAVDEWDVGDRLRSLGRRWKGKEEGYPSGPSGEANGHDLRAIEVGKVIKHRLWAGREDLFVDANRESFLIGKSSTRVDPVIVWRSEVWSAPISGILRSIFIVILFSISISTRDD